MKVSVVMAYFNRLQQLGVTLKTISQTSHNDIEVIVVDDASIQSQRVNYDCDFPLQVIRIEPKDKHWCNPCVPFNRGFAVATGDIVMIQNPECFHLGDLISHAVQYVNDSNYISYCCYSLSRGSTQQVNRLSDACAPIEKLQNLGVLRHRNSVVIGNERRDGWYNHPAIRPSGFHFCSAITMANLKKLGGFDEEFKNGVGFDDDDFIFRIKQMGLAVEMPLEPIAVHQYHEKAFKHVPGQRRASNSVLYKRKVTTS